MINADLLRLTARLQLTRARMLGLASFGALGVVIATAIRLETDGGPQAYKDGRDLVDAFGIGLYVPLCSLVLASAALGDLVEDSTLVYLWLRPIRRMRIALSAMVSTLGVSLPLTVIPVGVMAAITGDGRLVGAAVAATALGTVGYGSLFVAVGLRVRRSLVWGLAYVLIWEGAVARVARGAARMSVQIYARSLLNDLADLDPPRLGVATPTAIISVLAILLVSAVFTTVLLKRLEVA